MTNFKYLRVDDIDSDGHIDLNNLKSINENLYLFLKRYEVFENEIIISNAGTIGKIAILGKTNKHIILTENAVKLIKFNNDIHNDYLKIILNTKFLQEQMKQEHIQTTIPKLSIERISNLNIPIIQISVQKKIIDIMDSAIMLKKKKEVEAQKILDGVDEYLVRQLGISLPREEENTLENRTFQVGFSDVFNNRFDAQFYLKRYQDNLKNIKSKNFKTLKSIVSFSSETWNQKDIFEDEFPYIEISEIDLSYGMIKKINYIKIKDAPSRAKMIVRNKDIIISTTRPTRGAIALIDVDDILIASTGFSVIRHIFGEVDRKYLFRVLRSKMVLMQLGQRSTGGNYPAITQAELEKVLIPFPEDINKQQYIAGQIDLMEEKAQNLFRDASTIYKDATKEVEKIILGDSYES